MKRLLILSLSLLPVVGVYADAPVIQGHSVEAVTSSVSASSPETTVVGENPDDNTQQALVSGDDQSASSNNPGEIANQLLLLQQAVQDLRGQLEVQQHAILLLQNQVTSLSQGKAGKPLAMTTPMPVVSQPTPATQPVSAAQPTESLNTAPATTVPASLTPSAQPAIAPDSSTANQTEVDMYQKAYNLMLAKRYSDATVALQSYLQQYPQGVYAANSHYWLGEIALLSGNNAVAEAQFTTVVNQFAPSLKTPDAMLKLGMIYSEEQKWSLAKQTFSGIVQHYPNTPTADLAKQQLQQIEQNGHG